VVGAVDLEHREAVQLEDQVVVKDIVQLLQVLGQEILPQLIHLKDKMVVQELYQFQQDQVLEVVVQEQLEIIDQVQE
jgi:hypothetical protein